MMFRFLFLILVVASCSLSEEKTEIVIPKFPDPEHASMAGKARLLISLDSVNRIYDSLEYDDQGRMKWSTNNRWWRLPTATFRYDSNNYTIRYYYKTDMIDNYKFEYELREDTLFRKIYRSKHRNFVLNDTTFSLDERLKTIYYVIQEGQIKKSGGDNTEIKYTYDSLGRLSEKAVTSNSKLVCVNKFTYDGNSTKLKTQIEIQNNDTITFRYVNGILHTREEELYPDFKLLTTYKIKEIN